MPISIFYKGVIFGVVWLGLIGGAVSGGASLAPPPRVITAADQGRTLACKLNDNLVLQLLNPASGGYDQVTPIFAARILRLVSRKELPPEPTPIPRSGDFGQIIFEFQAISPGETDLVIRIARKWEVKKPPEEYFKARIKVMA